MKNNQAKHTPEQGDSDPQAHIRPRQEWLAVLARASLEELEQGWAGLELRPGYSYLRCPEVGLAMVRARMGGNGRRFNLGEMTVTRCTVSLESGLSGTGYVAGRSPRRAELVAILDALLQDDEHNALIKEKLIRPLAAGQARAREEESRRTAATKVDFFTMVRGED